MTLQQTSLQHAERVVSICLFLQRLASVAEAYTDTFKLIFLDLIYPLLEKASDTDGMIRQNALYCIKRICIACNYKDINHMIEANLDYVIDSICSRLNFLSAYPTTPRVIRSVVIHTVGAEGSTNALLKEIVQTLLNALDREISQKSNFSFSVSSNTLQYFTECSRRLNGLLRQIHCGAKISEN